MRIPILSVGKHSVRIQTDRPSRKACLSGYETII